MAEFKVHQLEGMQHVEIHLDDESVRAEAGALHFMMGDITVYSRVFPSLISVIKSLLADEAIFRPIYTGTGVITLECSLGGYHILDLHGESWILERGSYWASDGDVDVSFHREPVFTSILAGEGLIFLQTRVSGHGKVALTTRGPVKHVMLKSGQSMLVEGPSVIARTLDVGFKMRRPTKNLLGFVTSGEGWLRAYEGPGTILVTPRPYWRYWILVERRGEVDHPSKVTF
jgi:uncharacterized protein (AIM24 family)